MAAKDCIQVRVLEHQDDDLICSERFQKLYFNTKRFISVTQLSLGKKKFEEILPGNVEDCIFKYWSKSYTLKCEILNINKVNRVPGVIDINTESVKRSDHSEYSLSILESKKSSFKEVSNSSIEIININQSNSSEEKNLNSMNYSIQPNDISTNITINETEISTNPLIGASYITPSLSSEGMANCTASQKKSIKSTSRIDTSDLAPELSLADVLKLAKRNQFPKKELMIENKIKGFTPMLYFYTSTRIINKHPEIEE